MIWLAGQLSPARSSFTFRVIVLGRRRQANDYSVCEKHRRSSERLSHKPDRHLTRRSTEYAHRFPEHQTLFDPSLRASRMDFPRQSACPGMNRRLSPRGTRCYIDCKETHSRALIARYHSRRRPYERRGFLPKPHRAPGRRIASMARRLDRDETASLSFFFCSNCRWMSQC
jgi:hypothetical protein